MLFALTLLVPLLVAALWLYFRFSPRRANPRPVFWFNLVAVLLSVAASGAVVVMVEASMVGSADHGWWPVIGGFYSLVTLPACLAVAAGVRHLLFRTKRDSKPLETHDLSKTRF